MTNKNSSLEIIFGSDEKTLPKFVKNVLVWIKHFVILNLYVIEFFNKIQILQHTAT